MSNKPCKICGGNIRLKYKGLYDKRHGLPGRFEIYLCKDCGFMQTHPQLKRIELSKIYTKYYPRQNVKINEIKKSGKKIPNKGRIFWEGLSTTTHFATKGGNRVLDVGSGAGNSLVEITTLGGEAWGVDPDKNAEMIAKKLDLRFHQGLLDNCPFPKKYFDLITASQVIEHEPKPKKFLELCKQFLKKDGRIILSFPNTGALFRKIWGKNWLHWHIPYHLNHFNRKSFEILAEITDLKISSIKTITPNLWTILQIRSFLNSPEEGERDYMWDGKETKRKKNVTSKEKAVQALFFYLERLLFINRLIDSLGLGESFVVELKNRK